VKFNAAWIISRIFFLSFLPSYEKSIMRILTNTASTLACLILTGLSLSPHLLSLSLSFPHGFLFTLEVLHNITWSSYNESEGRERERKRKVDKDERVKLKN